MQLWFSKQRWLAATMPLIILAVHMASFGNWIIDDAGITYAYSRNLAEGYGLVAQPGQPPVEGYSNFLWVIVIWAFFKIGIFDPVWLPKLLSFLLVSGAFFLILWRFADDVRQRNAVIIALMLTALSTPVAIWLSSGLENGLNLFVIVLLFYLCVGIALEGPLTVEWHAVVCGVVATAVALTRPDGIMYFLAFPFLSILFHIQNRFETRLTLNRVAIYSTVFASLYGLFLVFRLRTFGSILPNTFYAKVQTSGDVTGILDSLPELASGIIFRVGFLMSGVAGPAGYGVLFGIVVASIVMIVRRRWTWSLSVVGVFFGLSLAIYSLLPVDWMPYHRFGTAFFLFMYLIAVLLFEKALATISLPKSRKMVYIVSIAVATVVASGVVAYIRSSGFARSPTVPFEYVQTRFADRFNDYANQLELDEQTSVLLPDIGGMLYYSDLIVVDMAGLISPEIAQRLRYEPNRELREYILNTVQPDFIHVHGIFTYELGFSEDEQFNRDYAAICEYVEPTIKAVTGREVFSGDYVRREHIEGQESAVARLRSKYGSTS